MVYFIHQHTHHSEVIKKNLGNTWLCRVITGELTVLFNYNEHNFEADTIFIVPDGVAFKVITSSEDMLMEVLEFHEKLMNVAYSLLGAEADFGTLNNDFWSEKQMKPPFSELFVMDYEMLKVAFSHSELIARHKMILTTLVHLLLVIFNSTTERELQTNTNNGKRSRQIITHFYELIGEYCLSGNKNISFYTEKLCISPRYLFKVCMHEAHKTPKDIIDQFLIAEIKNSLITTDKSLQQLADQFAFPDQSAFGQYFKRQEGLSPSEFRMRFK